MKENSSLVSIIMNCYDGEKYLEQSLKSVLGQTHQNWELIFWDNQSKDNSAKIFKNFKDKRFKYFLSDQHTNLHEARNLALKKAEGSYIAFLDTDDWWTLDKLEKQLPFFNDNEINLVYGNCWVYKENLIYKKRLYSKTKLPVGNIFEHLTKQHCVSIQTVMIREKSLIASKEIFDSSFDLISDKDFIIRFAYKNKFQCIQEPIAYYRIHYENYSKVKANEQIEQLWKWYNKIKNDSILSDKKYKKNLYEQIQYASLIRQILSKKKLETIKSIFSFTNDFRKIKLLVALVLPNFLFKYLKIFD